MSKSVVSRVTQCLSDDFEVFRKRDLSSEELLYLDDDGRVAIDRLVHHSIILELNVASYRHRAIEEEQGESGQDGRKQGKGMIRLKSRTKRPRESSAGDRLSRLGPYPRYPPFVLEMGENLHPMTTAAAIDRLVHHSIILELNVASYRLEQSKKNKARAAKTAENREKE